MKTRLDLPETHGRILRGLLNALPPKEMLWVLTGSCSLRLQGVDLDVHDIDLQTDGMNIRLIEAKLEKKMKIPVHLWETPTMRCLDGKAEIEGIEIELIADITRLQPDGTWTSFADLSRPLWLDWHGLNVPVFPLAAEALAYERMGRAEKAALIRETIRNAGN